MKHLITTLLLFLHPPHHHPPPPAMQFSQYCGDSNTLSIPLTLEGVRFLTDDWAFIFTAKRQARDTDAEALVQKASGAGITAADGIAAVSLLPSDTAPLDPGDVVWDLQAQHLTTGEIATVAVGRLSLLRDVTRNTVTSIPVITTDPPLPQGPPGKSAYQLAVEGGYTGTVQQWLADQMLRPQIYDEYPINDVAGSPQITIATALGTIQGSAGATVSVTVMADFMTGSPKTILVPVNHGDSAAVWGTKVRAALAIDADVTAHFTVDGAGSMIRFIRRPNPGYFATTIIRLGLANGNCTGVVPDEYGSTAEPGEETIIGTPGTPGDVRIVAISNYEFGVLMCVRETPVIWLSLTN